MPTATANPYSAPDAALETHSDAATYDPAIFSFKGRIGRMRYLAYGMGLMMLVSILAGVLAGVMIPVLGATGDTGGIIGIAVMGLVYAGVLVIAVMFGKRRLNDLNRSGWWYLVGYCHLRQGMRTFRVDRIRDIALREESFRRPEGFDVQAYLEGMFADQPVVQATLHFVPEAAHLALTNASDWEIVQENPDGSVDVQIRAPDLYWLASLVLSFSTWVTVLDPPELRALVREWALGTAALYQDDP